MALKGKVYTKTEEAHKRFEKLSKICLFSMVLIIFATLMWFVVAKNDASKRISFVLFWLETVSTILMSWAIVKKRTEYSHMFLYERNAVVRIGIFKELYEEYLHDGFEYHLLFDKLLHEEYYNNSIDIALQKNFHEFLIEIDENIISIIVDKETECPIEMEYQLIEFSTLEQIYLAINEFIEAHST